MMMNVVSFISKIFVQVILFWHLAAKCADNGPGVQLKETSAALSSRWRAGPRTIRCLLPASSQESVKMKYFGCTEMI